MDYYCVLPSFSGLFYGGCFFLSIFRTLKTRDLDGIIPKLDKILTRCEAVRFAPVLSQDAQADLVKIKKLLEVADHEWK